MARNDRADALGALIGLGILGSMMGDDTKSDVPQFIKEMQRQQVASGKSSTTPQQAKPTPVDGAKAAKEIYDAYITAGFTEEQGFELLKTVLTSGNRK